MKIVHIDLTGPYTEGMTYQENILARINVQDGHDVYFIATEYAWKDNKIQRVPSGWEKMKNGISLIRIPYEKLLIPILTDKVRIVKGLVRILEDIQPEIVMLHGYQTLSVIPLVAYLKKHRNVKLAVDTHADALNSAQNIVSKIILHRMIYTFMGKLAIRYTQKIWCISRDVMVFSEKVNRIPADRLEYFPLGGEIFEQERYIEKRKKIRNAYNIAENDILFVHSGKMSAQKRTIDILRALQKVKDERIRLFIIGMMDNDVKREFEKISIGDSRINYVGWKSGEELLEYLCAADVYIQPGSQSATMQNAACCACALALYPYESHKYLFGDDVFYIKNEKEIEQMLNNILDNPQIVEAKRRKTFLTAKEQLDYRKLAEKVYNL